jgi:hypothetical protein
MFHELARDACLGPTMQQAATLHLSRCPRCAARLTEERRLTAGLAALAQSTRSREAPPLVERFLQEELLARHAGPRARFASVTLTGGKWSWGLAGVAAALLVATAALWLWRAPAVAPEARPIATAPVQQAPEPLTPAAQGLRPPTARPVIVAEEEQRNAANEPNVLEARDIRPETEQAAVGEIEEAELRKLPAPGEEFVPLLYGGDPGLMETGQVLRVELPTRVLESFGIPVQEELRTRRVRADLLVGEDGIARAIRFVH